jgi:Membrane bound O-acyl transferase family
MERAKPALTGARMGWLPLVVLPLGAFGVRGFLPAWAFMWILSISIYLGLKWLSWWKVRSRLTHVDWRSAAYLLTWPGMDAESFLDASRRVPSPSGSSWYWAISKTFLGAVLFWAVPRVFSGQPLLQGWVGMLGLILLLHFGGFELIALFWQSLGIDARPIMSGPFRSTSLSEFWGRRWNLGFRQLSYDLIFRPLQKCWGVWAAGFLVFLVSGLIHDLVISLPARGGYGLPTAYFVLQGLGVTVERSEFGKQFGLRDGFRGWLFTVVIASGPAFWLLHPPFVMHVILPFMKAVHAT